MDRLGAGKAGVLAEFNITRNDFADAYIQLPIYFIAQNRRVQESTRMQLFQESIQRMEKSLEVSDKIQIFIFWMSSVLLQMPIDMTLMGPTLEVYMTM